MDDRTSCSRGGGCIARTPYASAAGGGSCTASSPCSLQAAFTEAAGGDTVELVTPSQVQPYEGDFLFLNESETQITVEAAPGVSPEITATCGGCEALNIYPNTMVTFQNIVFTDSLINIGLESSALNVTFTGDLFEGSSVFSEVSNQLTIDHSTFENGGGFTTNSGVVSIEDSTFYKTGGVTDEGETTITISDSTFDYNASWTGQLST